MTRSIIIGLGGPKHHGKSLAADIIEEISGLNFVRMSFAKPLKQMMVDVHAEFPELFQMADEDVASIWSSNKTSRAREVAQGLGTNIGRRIDEDIWVKVFIRQWEKAGRPNCIIDDVRFPNELHCFENTDGVDFFSIRILRNKLMHEIGKDMHPSETAVKDEDFLYIIKSDEGKEEMLKHISKVYDDIKGVIND